MKSSLHVIDTSGPGGAETVFVELVRTCVQLGMPTAAVVRKDGWVKRQLDNTGAKVYVLDCKGAFNFKFVKNLMKIVHDEKVDIIQAHLLGSIVYCALVGLLTRTRVIATFHGLVDVSKTERLRWLKFLLIRLGASHIVAVSQSLKKMLCAERFIRNVTVIYNGVDTEPLLNGQTTRSTIFPNIPSEAMLIGSLGNIRKAKNYPLAIEVIELLRARGINAHLAIAGDDSNTLAESLRESIRAKNLEQYVHLLGFVDNVPNFLSSIDYFLLSSSSEGHPLSLIQAMCSGVPVIATRCGVEEIVENRVDAMLGDVGDAPSLADAIQKLSEDGQLKKRLVENGRKKAMERYSVDGMRNDYLRLYYETDV